MDEAERLAQLLPPEALVAGHGRVTLGTEDAARFLSGLRRRGETFIVDPCIPSAWPEYQIVWQFLETRYAITVSNPKRRCRSVVSATLDGTPVDAKAIPLRNDGLAHEVQILLG